VVERLGDPFASLDLAMLGSAHDVSGLSRLGSVTSDVVGADAPVPIAGHYSFNRVLRISECAFNMNTSERASLTGMVIAFFIVVFGAILESQTTCTQ
jgi:hypothetical protein